MSLSVSIIILNWDGWKDTIECLESLFWMVFPDYNVILIDNGSQDESIKKIKEYCEGKIEVESNFFQYNPGNKPIRIIEYTKEEIETCDEEAKRISELPSNRRLILIKNERNYGFAEGNNIGMRYALKKLNPDYILLLNNDTVLDKEALTELIKVGEYDYRNAIIGPKTYYYNTPNKIQLTWNRINFWTGTIFLAGTGNIDEGQYEHNVITDYVPGSCLLIKRKIIEKIGVFNANYYCYWEETDYCMRVKKAGYLNVFCPKAKIWHKVSQSAKKISGFSIYYMTRNRFWFIKQHAKKNQYLSFLILFFTYQFFAAIFLKIFYYRDISMIILFIRGVVDGIKVDPLTRSP